MSPPTIVQVDGIPAVAGQILVRYRTGVSVGARSLAIAGTVGERAIGGPSSDLVLVDTTRDDLETAIEELRAREDVVYAEPNYVVVTDVATNDPELSKLWGLDNVGQQAGGQNGTIDADIDAPEAWSLTTGSTSVAVGMIDTGIDYTHPDLAANVWTAPSAFTVTLGGSVVSCPAGSHGLKLLRNWSGQARGCDPKDDQNQQACVGGTCTYGRHGTHTSGTVGAVGDNGQGITGVSPRVTLVGLKFLAYDGFGSVADAIEAIDAAIQLRQLGLAPIRILNNSWGGGFASQAVVDAIQRARDANILFVSAAGNAKSDNDVVATTPGGIVGANTVNVAATDNRDALAGFSNFGKTTVDLGAPGVAIYSTAGFKVGYQYLSGTSMASPHVAGAAALVLAACPNLDTIALKRALVENTDAVPALAGRTISGGRLDLDRAVRSCSGPFAIASTPGFRAVSPGHATTFAITATRNGGFAGPIGLSIDGLPPGVSASFSPSSLGAQTSSTLQVSASATAPLGTYTLAIHGTSGAITSTTSVQLRVVDPDFVFAASSSQPGIVVPGASASYQIHAEAVGSFAANVQLAASGLPAGVGAVFSPSSITATGDATLTVTTPSGLPDGAYTFTITGTGGGKVHAVSAKLEARRPAFTLKISPASATCSRSSLYCSMQATVTSTFGFAGPVTLAVAGLPAGASTTLPTNVNVTAGGQTTAIFAVQPTMATPLGTYTLTYTASGGGVTRTLSQTLVLKP